jgi:circadian clock protein KaiB
MTDLDHPQLDAGPATDEIDEFELRLYVTGRSPRCVRALENLERVCESYLDGRYHIEVVDLLENPRLAVQDQILAVPTLVRKLPQPIRKIVGDLSNLDHLLVGLQLRPHVTHDPSGTLDGAPDG